MAKEGSTVSGLMDSFALAVSIALQHGVPLKLLCEKFAHTRFEPSGWTSNPDIGFAKSIMDYIFRWLQLRFLTGQQQMLFDNFRPRTSALDRRRRVLEKKWRPASGPVRSREAGAGSVPFTPPTPCRHRRPGRRAHLQLLRQHHDPQRQLLPLHELREYERVLVAIVIFRKGVTWTHRSWQIVCRTVGRRLLNPEADAERIK